MFADLCLHLGIILFSRVRLIVLGLFVACGEGNRCALTQIEDCVDAYSQNSHYVYSITSTAH